jgi:hypothetical protein
MLALAASALVFAACGGNDTTAPPEVTPEPDRAVTVQVNMDVWSGYDAQPEEPWTTG